MLEYIQSFDEIKLGFIFCLLGSDRPIVESLSPNLIDQRNVLNNQFMGMTAIPFSYEEYEKTRITLIDYINKNLNDNDKAFLISFEEGAPEWANTDYATFKDYPLFP
jgi:hypothetical protein